MSDLQDYLVKRGITEDEMEEAEKELRKKLKAYERDHHKTRKGKKKK